MIERVPTPETRSAILWSESLGRPTRHEYKETRATTIRFPHSAAVWEFVFRCVESGAERRWGVVRRNA